MFVRLIYFFDNLGAHNNVTVRRRQKTYTRFETVLMEWMGTAVCSGIHLDIRLFFHFVA